MAEESKKLYMEMQMDELKASLRDDDDEFDEDEDDEFDPLAEAKQKQAAAKKINKNSEKNIELAKMYEDAAEYEIELASFEAELAVIKANTLADMADALTKELPSSERNYAQELKGILISTWTHQVETLKTHPKEQLDLVKEAELCDVVEKLTVLNPEYEGDFSSEVKSVFIKRLETLIDIKKAHIEEEIEEIYIAGLKPSYVQRIYKQVHGLDK